MGRENSGRPRIAVLYHFFHPDDVISARIMSEFCLDLHARGWQVEALPCNRSCHETAGSYPVSENWHGVQIRRIWRPGLRQASGLGRILNAAWMLVCWSLLGLRTGRTAPDVVLMGTDPILSVLVAFILHKLRRRIRVVHWCFDLYPELAIADGLLAETSWMARALRFVLRFGYRSCDLVADIGSCMRQRLKYYGHQGRKVTLVPWSLVEPDIVECPDAEARRDLFGDQALGLLYSGSFGRAHSFAEFLELARRLRGTGVQFCFGARGNRVKELHAAIQPDDTNISLAGFAPEAQLGKRLGAADIHLVSLRPEWSGMVVPSKFFGALAAGRPVLFAGPRNASIARWIEDYGVGWILDSDSQEKVAYQLQSLARDRGDLLKLQRHCQQVYQLHFARKHVMDRWHRELTELVARPR